MRTVTALCVVVRERTISRSGRADKFRVCREWRVGHMPHGAGRLGWRHARMVQRLLHRPRGSRDRRPRPRLHRRRRRVRGDQGRRQRPVRADPAPRPARVLRAPGSDCPRPTTRWCARRSRRCSRARTRVRPDPDHVHRRHLAARVRAATRTNPTLVVVVTDANAVPGRPPRPSSCRGRATSEARSPGSRRRRTPRTSSRWRTPRSAAHPRRSSPTPPATSARAPAPTSSASSATRSSRRRCRPGCLSGVTRNLVVEWCGVERARHLDGRVRRRPTRCSSPRRRATCRACTRSTSATFPADQPVTAAVAAVVARARAAGRRPVDGSSLRRSTRRAGRRPGGRRRRRPTTVWARSTRARRRSANARLLLPVNGAALGRRRHREHGPAEHDRPRLSIRQTPGRRRPAAARR